MTRRNSTRISKRKQVNRAALQQRLDSYGESASAKMSLASLEVTAGKVMGFSAAAGAALCMAPAAEAAIRTSGPGTVLSASRPVPNPFSYPGSYYNIQVIDSNKTVNVTDTGGATVARLGVGVGVFNYFNYLGIVNVATLGEINNFCDGTEACREPTGSDFNNDGRKDFEDMLIWQRNRGLTSAGVVVTGTDTMGNPYTSTRFYIQNRGDANNNGIVNQQDRSLLVQGLGKIPGAPLWDENVQFAMKPTTVGPKIGEFRVVAVEPGDIIGQDGGVATSGGAIKPTVEFLDQMPLPGNDPGLAWKSAGSDIPGYAFYGASATTGGDMSAGKLFAFQFNTATPSATEDAIHYGWVKINMQLEGPGDGTSGTAGRAAVVTVDQWGYETVAGMPIIAGDTGSGIVPEPNTLSLGLLALGGIGVMRHRQRKKRREEKAADSKS